MEALYDATGGPNWTTSDNWLTDAPFGDWSGVKTDASGRVVWLSLWGKNLAGKIPPELGGLLSLESLNLGNNRLTGAMPPQLGDLLNLTYLAAESNQLTGQIPRELGKLTRLKELYLLDNELTGQIPSELGDLASLRWLFLFTNRLSGPIPRELGSLRRLRGLDLANNELTGPVPSEFGGMLDLGRLSVAHNGGLSGALPTSLTDLRSLESLMAPGTGLCAPQDPGFQAWLQRIRNWRIASCTGASTAYLTQGVQSREFPVPLVADEKALLRVFVTAEHATTAGIPPVRTWFYLNGTETHVTDIPAKATPIPTEVAEHDLSQSANAEIPAEIIQPGLEMVIQIDPDGRLDAGLGVSKRIPETGRATVDVREMPVFDLTVIPFLWRTDPNREVVETAEAMEADPGGHELLWDTRTLLPIRAIDVTGHEPVLSSSNNAHDILADTEAIRAVEGGRGHYMGMMSGPVEGARGVANLHGPASFAVPIPWVIAHELGHNLSLRHAPCGTPRPDPAFPYPDGSTGAWGFDFREGGRLVGPHYNDLMSYCNPRWISDYHFTNALRTRLFDHGPPAAVATSLLLWGGIGAEGQPYLNPAFVVDAPPALPDSAGAYEVTGRIASDDELFSLSFAMPEVGDGDGSASFAFILPVRPGWEENLASITLSGPGGSFTLDGESDLSMAILRNPRNGQVRGILSDLPPPAQAAADAVGQSVGTGLEVLFSRGIPGAEAWRR